MRLSPWALLAVAAIGCNKDKAGAGGGESEGGPAMLSAVPGLGAFLTGFEGEIDALFKEAGPAGKSANVAVFVKAGKLRFEVPEGLGQGPAMMLGPKAYVIFDSPGKKIDVVADSRKEVIVIDLEKSGQDLKGVGAPPSAPHGPQAAPQGPPTKLTKTGKSDTVAGYSCDLWDITSDHREGTVCVAQEGASWFSIPLTGIPTEHAWAVELLDGKHFPLRFVGYDKDGATEKTRVEVTKIDKKTLPPTEFEYPPTYKVVDLAQMLAPMMHFAGGMPGGMPMPGMPMQGMPMPAPAHSHH
jgi:hypothetical protein